jgi:hypothetical protein
VRYVQAGRVLYGELEGALSPLLAASPQAAQR